MSVGACARAERAGSSWSIDFACAEEAARTERVTAKIEQNDCEAPGSLIYEEQITRGGVARVADPGTLSPGRYAFSALAVDAQGTEIARACVSVTLPSATPVVVTLSGSRVCEAGGGVTTWPDAGAARDAGVGPEVDGAPEVDAGPEADAGPAADAATACGTLDTDGDMTPDCDDGCPMDANKTTPGECGCGQAEGSCDGLSVSDVVGGYQRLPVENDWHVGRIEQTANGLAWINNAGVQWTLIPDLENERLLTTSDCPYYTDPEGKAFLLVLQDARVTGFWFNNELYSSSQ